MPSSGEVALKFEKDSGRVYYYSMHEIKMFDTIIKAQANVNHEEYFISISDFISKQEFDSFLNIFEDDPVIDMMDAERFAHTLRMTDYLGIKDDQHSLDLFSKICRYGVLGAHRNDILNSQLYELEPRLARASHVYTHLAQGLADAFSLQVRIMEEGKDDPVRVLVFHTPFCECVGEHKALDFDAGIEKIKVTRTAQDKTIKDNQLNFLDIIVWLFDHASAKHLDFSECYVGEHIIAKVANLECLEVLNLSRCSLPPDSLVLIGNSPVLQKVLSKLYVDNNEVSTNDMYALALLAVLKVLNLGYCSLLPSSLVPIGNSPTLKGVLNELYVNDNTFDLNDINALISLSVLQVLNLSNFELLPGFLAPIGNSLTLQETLGELHADDNEFGSTDTEALALLSALRVLDLGYCSLPLGSLIPIGSSTKLKGILRELNLSNNTLSLEDTEALALLAALEVLNLGRCDLPPKSLVPIGSSPTLREILRELYANNNVFSLEDTKSLASLFVLQVLDLSNCELPPGSLVPIGRSPTLRETLQELHANDNKFGPNDTEAISFLAALKLLKLGHCSLQPGSLVPIGNSLTLQRVHRELNASINTFGLRDVEALALLFVLRVLDLSDCELRPGFLVPIGSSPTLQEMLCELDVSYNTFGPGDIEALEPLAVLQVLKLRYCLLQPDSLVPIGNSLTLQRVLRELHVDDNAFGFNDTTALALLTALRILDLSCCSLPPGSLAPIYDGLILPGTLYELDVTGNQTLSLEDKEIITESNRFITVKY